MTFTKQSVNYAKRLATEADGWYPDSFTDTHSPLRSKVDKIVFTGVGTELYSSTDIYLEPGEMLYALMVQSPIGLNDDATLTFGSLGMESGTKDVDAYLTLANVTETAIKDIYLVNVANFAIPVTERTMLTFSTDKTATGTVNFVALISR